MVADNNNGKFRYIVLAAHPYVYTATEFEPEKNKMIPVKKKTITVWHG